MSSIGRIVRKNHSAVFWCTMNYPKSKRQAVYTLYALIKHFDDLCSSTISKEDKTNIIEAWQKEIANIYDKKIPSTDIVCVLNYQRNVLSKYYQDLKWIVLNLYFAHQ